MRQINTIKMDRAIKQNALFVLSFAEFWDLLSFFGTVAVLVLYTTKVFLFSDHTSYTIYGIYLALLCALPVVGGILIDKFIGYFRSVVIGALLLIMGNLLLVIQYTAFLYLGLAVTICGTSLYKTSCTSLVGTFYRDNPLEKDKAYTFFYAALNCGAITGPIVYGALARFFGWNVCFLFSALGISLCLLFIIIKKRYFKLIPETVQYSMKNNIQAILWLLVLLGFVSGAFFFAKQFNGFFFIFFVIIAIVFYRLLAKQNLQDRKRLYGILTLLLFCLFFFSASLQVGSSLALFLNRYVNRSLFGWMIPTTFFTSLDPLFVVLAAPIFAIIWGKLRQVGREPGATIKLVWGLIIGGAGFLSFLLSVKLSVLGYHYVVLLMLLLGYILIGAGEICLTPGILRAINDYSPKSILNTMTGSWYLFMAFSGYLGSLIAKLGVQEGDSIKRLHQTSEIIGFYHVFLFIAIMTFVAGILLLLMSRPLNGLFCVEVENEKCKNTCEKLVEEIQ